MVIVTLNVMAQKVQQDSPSTGADAFKTIKSIFDKENTKLKENAQQTRQHLENMFAFCEIAFPEGQELLILVTELTINTYSAGFISRYGCEEYFRHNKELLFYERQKDIIDSLENLDL